MFSSIFYLILALLAISLSPHEGVSNAHPWMAFFISISLYALLIGLIFCQNILFRETLRKNRALILNLVNLELLGFLILYHYLLGGDQIFFSSFQLFPTTLQTFFSVALFFFGLWVFHYTGFKQKRLHLPHENASSYASAQVRFIFPFAIPFLLLTFLTDIFQNSSLFDFNKMQEMSTLSDTLILLGFSLVFMLLLLLFLPPLIQWIWQCQPLEPSPLKERLQAICERAGFKHPKLKTWTVMNQSMTAAIIGVVAPFRYILFTKKLLNSLSPEAVEAILVHEIGHSYRRHLLLYPFILFGFITLAGIFSLIFAQTLENTLNLEILLNPTFDWQLIVPLLFFLCYGAFLMLYFRYVFGFFSRLFERQADLHVYILDVPPEHMIKALDELGVATGHTHDHPSWHHYSIRQRIDFINKTIQSPSVVTQHHQKVKKTLLAYFITLLVGIILFLSPWLPNVFPFSKIQETFSSISNGLNQSWNASLRNDLAQQYQNDYQLTGHSEIIQKTLENTFESFDRGRTVEEINLIASQRLYKAGEVSASATLLIQLWHQISPNHYPELFLEHLTKFTVFILQQPSINPEKIQRLQQEYEKKMAIIKTFKKDI
ncbi:M48 family metallopeptidase [Parachlamydia acanthamoebae]|uniref:Peptidase M48 domain-containing protein n=2 Tax=Parachlamydia acanthamoebae TaxID=83552 RepID=F8KXN9_PARAV|nr:M48 family metallopeptidase [Parachlamydia acanthamoebae]EFB42829.1 hypothetical protein pah_c001o013 [Parachlamydia acanthamoebae str. Hall's coccus]KIA76740.1 hypothetical protein DB43_HK00130 [Parachlamydia acanthamoebae]CCB87548.1 putative uncharacterized protein [Parachlamydia acanthamoebae UV-7]